MLTRIYHDIGLAAVAEALRLPPDGFEPEMIESLERGELYLLRPPTRLRTPGRTRKRRPGERAPERERNRWFT